MNEEMAEEIRTALTDLDHAFWDTIDILTDNLPDKTGDPETDEYAAECYSRYINDKEEFATACKKLKDILKKQSS